MGGSRDTRFMPQGIKGMFVSPDGTTFTNIFWGEGCGHVAVIGTDRDVHPRPNIPGHFGWGHNGGKAVAANSKYDCFSQILEGRERLAYRPRRRRGALGGHRRAPEILRFDAQGRRLPQTITLPAGSRAGSFCIDPKGGILIGSIYIANTQSRTNGPGTFAATITGAKAIVSRSGTSFAPTSQTATARI